MFYVLHTCFANINEKGTGTGTDIIGIKEKAFHSCTIGKCSPSLCLCKKKLAGGDKKKKDRQLMIFSLNIYCNPLPTAVSAFGSIEIICRANTTHRFTPCDDVVCMYIIFLGGKTRYM